MAKRYRTSNADAAPLRACAGLLSILGEPERAWSQAFITRLRELFVEGLDWPERPVADHLGHGLSEALATLTPRQRTILLRCDARGENATAVAKSLYVSRRHLFRERRAALEKLVQILSDDASHQSAQWPRVDADGPVEHRITVAHALENSGNRLQAAEMLERLAAAVDNPGQRLTVELELVRLDRNADRLSMARRRANSAMELAKRVEANEKWRCAEASLAMGWIEMTSGDFETATRMAQSSSVELQSWADGSACERLVAARVDASLLRAYLALGRGELELSSRFAREAWNTAERARIDLRSKIPARSFAAIVGFFRTGDFEAAERELLNTYREAMRYGLVLEALDTATQLARVYRAHGHHQTAVDFLQPVETLAGLVGAKDAHIGVLNELVCASLILGDLEGARSYFTPLTEIGSHCTTIFQVPLRITASRFHLATRSYRTALTAAEDAEHVCTRTGLRRFLATSLCLQSGALAGLAEFTRAHHLANEAMSLARDGGDFATVAAARSIAAQVSAKTSRRIRAFCS